MLVDCNENQDHIDVVQKINIVYFSKCHNPNSVPKRGCPMTGHYLPNTLITGGRLNHVFTSSPEGDKKMLAHELGMPLDEIESVVDDMEYIDKYGINTKIFGL